MAVSLGHFVYENAGTGCLLSKYCNAELNTPLTEAASRIEVDEHFPEDPFCGVFLATWVENIPNLETHAARLIITRKEDIDASTEQQRVFLPGKYILRWLGINDASLQFDGEAMLYKDTLIGAYR